jgi:hypothetical protein
MRRWPAILGALVAILVPGILIAQMHTNPGPGDVWTYFGPTLGGGWGAPPGGGSGSPGGTTGQIQWNNAGSFAGVTIGGDFTINTTTGVGTIGSNAITTGKIIDGAITNAKLATPSITIAGITFNLGGSVTSAALTAALGGCSTTLQGTVPASGGGTTNFLRADCTWAAPPGGGGAVFAGRTTHGNSAYSILSTDHYVVTSAALTAPRVWTLPAASAVSAGYLIVVQDEFGGVTSTNTIAITPAGSDTINGANNASSSTIAVAYGGYLLASDGTSKWSVVANTIQQAYSCAATKFATSLSAAGVTTCTQPAFTDIGGTAAAAQLPLATTGAFGAVKPDGTTVTISGGVISSVSGGAGTVTNAANLADKAVVVGNGGTTGVKTLASLGNSGDLLTSNGAGALPSFQAPSGGSGSGALTLVSTQTASSSANLHFASLGASTSLNQYQLICRNLVPATDTANLLITLGQSGTEKTSGYKWGWHYLVLGGATGSAGGSADSSIQIANNQSSTNGMDLLEAVFEGLGSAVKHTMAFKSHSNLSGGGEMYTNGSGTYSTDTTAINDIYVKFSSGNIASGKCSLFSYTE